jgi:hypothetical protein
MAYFAPDSPCSLQVRIITLQQGIRITVVKNSEALEKKPWLGQRVLPVVMRYLPMALILASNLPSAAQTIYTAPRGYYTVKVPGAPEPGMTARTYLGIQLLPDPKFVGLVQGVNGNSVNLGTSDHTIFSDPVRPCYLHVLDGTGRGFVTDVTAFQTSGVVCAENPGPWLQAATRVMIRPHSNISDILGADNRFGFAAGTNAGSADNVVLWDAATQKEKIYYFHSTRNRWEQKNIVADAGTASIRFPQGFYLVRRSPGMLRIALSGNVGSEAVLLPVRPGAGVFSLPVNLSGSLDAIVKTTGNFAVNSGPNANSADILTFEEPVTGQQRGPFYHQTRAGLLGWREVGVDGGDAALQPLDYLSTLVFRRHSGPGRVLAEGSLVPPLVPRPPIPPDPEPGELPFTVEFPYFRSIPPGYSPTIETSTDLQTWNTYATPTLNANNRIEFQLPAGQGRAFYRLALTAN